MPATLSLSSNTVYLTHLRIQTSLSFSDNYHSHRNINTLCQITYDKHIILIAIITFTVALEHPQDKKIAGICNKNQQFLQA